MSTLTEKLSHAWARIDELEAKVAWLEQELASQHKAQWLSTITCPYCKPPTDIEIFEINGTEQAACLGCLQPIAEYVPPSYDD